MEAKNLFTKTTISNADLGPGFLVIAIGGAGKDSAKSAKKQHRAAGSPFPLLFTAIDTDPVDFDVFDFAIDIALTREAVNAMASNPRRYGPACRAIVEKHPDLLNSEALGHGARMTRLFTQTAFELFEERILKGLRAAIHELLRQGQFQRIQPVIIASFGGGTGSAGVILSQDFFMDGIKKRQITLGLQPDLVARPVLFCVDGYAHALQQTNDVAPDWILANVYATRVELAEYEKAGKGYQYSFHLGLGNCAGAIFATIQQVCEANGAMCWEWMANFARFKAHVVNNLDFYIDACRYQGDDVAESHHPKDEIPDYGKKPDGETTDQRTSGEDSTEEKGQDEQQR